MNIYYIYKWFFGAYRPRSIKKYIYIYIYTYTCEICKFVYIYYIYICIYIYIIYIYNVYIYDIYGYFTVKKTYANTLNHPQPFEKLVLCQIFLKNILIFAKVAGCGLQNEPSLTGIS